MDEKINLDLEDFSSEPFLDAFIKEITQQDPSFLIGIFVALAVVIITIGKHANLGMFGPRSNVDRKEWISQSFSDKSRLLLGDWLEIARACAVWLVGHKQCADWWLSMTS